MSATRELSVELRNKTTKRDTERQRKSGILPGVVYGHGVEPIMLSVKRNEFIKLLHEVGTTGLINLKSSDKSLDGMTTVIKDMQYHVVKDDIIHIDFQAIKKGEEIKITVPINFVGEAIGVKEGGELQTSLNELEISCKPKDMPTEIEVNIAELKVGDSLHVRDLKLAKGLKVLNSEEEMVVSVALAKTMSVELETTEETEELTTESNEETTE